MGCPSLNGFIHFSTTRVANGVIMIFQRTADDLHGAFVQRPFRAHHLATAFFYFLLHEQGGREGFIEGVRREPSTTPDTPESIEYLSPAKHLFIYKVSSDR